MYSVRLRKSAAKSLDEVPVFERENLKARLAELENNPRAHFVRRLKGSEAFKFRVGDWRILFTVDQAERIVTVLRIGHRSDVYR